MKPLDHVVGRLRAAGCDPSPSVPTPMSLRCPAHRGKRKNLSVRTGHDGRVLVHCHHAGEDGVPSCSPEAIVDAIGLGMEDLFPPRSPGYSHYHNHFPSSNCTIASTSQPHARAFTSSWQTLDAALNWTKVKQEVRSVASWIYHDDASREVMAVARFDKADGEKSYRPYHCRDDGSWAVGDPPGLLPLYRLPELLEQEGVIVTEGEKCADAIRLIGIPATTSAHGAGGAQKTDWSPLAGKWVILIPDNDEAGEGYVRSVIRQLQRLEPRPRVKVVRLPGLQDGEDFIEWSALTLGDPPLDQPEETLRFELRRLCEETPFMELEAIVEPAPLPVPAPLPSPLPLPSPSPSPDFDAETSRIHSWPAPPAPAAFTSLPGSIIELIEPTTEADPAGMLLHLVAGFGNAVGRGAWILADGKRHHANEFICVVGATAKSRKGTGWDRVKPVLELMDPDWALNRIANGLTSGEGLIWNIRDPMTEPGKNGKEATVDPGVADKRLLVVETEFGNVLRVLSRDSNTLSGVLRQAWDSGHLRTMAKNFPASATWPHVSLAGHITADELKKTLADVEIFNGLGNRILWSCVKRWRKLPFGGQCDQAELTRLAGDLGKALELARSVGEVGWADEAAPALGAGIRAALGRAPRPLGRRDCAGRGSRVTAGLVLRPDGFLRQDPRPAPASRTRPLAVLRRLRRPPLRRLTRRPGCGLDSGGAEDEAGGDGKEGDQLGSLPAEPLGRFNRPLAQAVAKSCTGTLRGPRECWTSS